MATDDEEFINFCQLSSLVLNIGTSLLLRILKNKIQPSTLDEFLNQPTTKADISKLNKHRLKVINDKQYEILTEVPVCEDKFDISLIVKLLLNVCPTVVQPGTRWDNNPPEHDLSLVADLIRLRKIRNERPLPAHASRAKLTKVEFTDTWAMVKRIFIRRSKDIGETGGAVEKEINDLLERKPGQCECQELITLWKKWREDDERTYADFNEKLSSIESSLESLHDKVDVGGQSVHELHQELNTLLKNQGIDPITLDKNDLSNDQVVQSLLKHIKRLNEISSNQQAGDEVDGPRRLVPNNKGMTDKELDQIAQKIGNEWQQLGIYLGYRSVQLDRLTELYRNQVQGRIFKMLQKWHSVVLQHNENPQKFLASAFVEIKNLEVAQDIDEEATPDMRYKPQKSTLEAVQQINFDLR